MQTGIYQIKNTITGHVYIGRAVNVRARLAMHRWKLKNRRHNNAHLQASYDKHGVEAFTASQIIVCRKDDLPMYEKIAIRAFNASDRGCGFNKMGVDDAGHYTHGPEARQASTDYNLQRWQDPAYRAARSEQQKLVIAKQWQDPEFRSMRSRAASEQWNDDARREAFHKKQSARSTATWKSQAFRDKRHAAVMASWANPERKRKAGIAMKALWQNPDYRRKTLAARGGKKGV